MLQVQGLRKSYGVDEVLAGVSFVLHDGEHLGLVSPNGTGKSTLLRCLVGIEPPDGGSVTLSPPTLTIGYLPQALLPTSGQTIATALGGPDGLAAASALEATTAALASAADQSAALAAYAEALARFEQLGGYEQTERQAAVLSGLGLGDVDPNRPVASLSGGQQTRLGLARLLLQAPDLLLLDEPTNHLDLAALDWLETYLRGYRGSVLLVSHDRAFLDRTVTRILYLDPRSRTIRSYPGSFQDFAAARAQERAQHREAWQRQQEYVAQVQQDVSRLKGEAVAIERGTTSRQPGVRRLARKKARLALSREHKLERYLASDERVEKPPLEWGLKLDFGPAPPGGRAVVEVARLSFGYPGRPPLLEDAQLTVRHGERLALVGPNGAGKTTLLRLLSGELTPLAGTVRLGANVRFGRLDQDPEALDPTQTVLAVALAERPMSETDARHFLHYFLLAGDAVFRPVGACSLGERTRLQLARLVLRGCNLLLLDEPLNHLDVEGREHFAAALEAYPGTVILVAHDRAFLRKFAGRLVEIRDGALRSFPGGYDDYLRWR